MTNLHQIRLAILVSSVPYVLSRSILLKVLDFWGGTWEVHIDINFDSLEDKLHYCNKSRDIIMIVGFHLFRSLNVSFCSAIPNLSPLFHHLNYVFFLGLWEHAIAPFLFSCNALCKAFWGNNKLIYFFFTLDLIQGTS